VRRTGGLRRRKILWQMCSAEVLRRLRWRGSKFLWFPRRGGRLS